MIRTAASLVEADVVNLHALGDGFNVVLVHRPVGHQPTRVEGSVLSLECDGEDAVPMSVVEPVVCPTTFFGLNYSCQDAGLGRVDPIFVRGVHPLRHEVDHITEGSASW